MNIHPPRRDLTKQRLSQQALEQVIAAAGGAKEVEDIYSLSAMQQGILFHSVYEPESTLYFETLSCRLRGPLDVDAFEGAWQVAIDRHAMLRTAFVGTDLEVPVQVVMRRV